MSVYIDKSKLAEWNRRANENDEKKNTKVIELSGTRFFCRKSFQARALALEEIKPERTYMQENTKRTIYEYILTPRLVEVLNSCARGEVKYILVK